MIPLLRLLLELPLLSVTTCRYKDHTAATCHRIPRFQLSRASRQSATNTSDSLLIENQYGILASQVSGWCVATIAKHTAPVLASEQQESCLINILNPTGQHGPTPSLPLTTSPHNTPSCRCRTIRSSPTPSRPTRPSITTLSTTNKCRERQSPSRDFQKKRWKSSRQNSRRTTSPIAAQRRLWLRA